MQHWLCLASALLAVALGGWGGAGAIEMTKRDGMVRELAPRSLQGVPYHRIQNPCPSGQVHFDGRCRAHRFFERFVTDDTEPYTVWGPASKDHDNGALVMQTLKDGTVEVLTMLPTGTEVKRLGARYIADYEVASIFSISSYVDRDGFPTTVGFVRSAGAGTAVGAIGLASRGVPTPPLYGDGFGLAHWEVRVGWPGRSWRWGSDLCADDPEDCGPEMSIASGGDSSDTEFCDVFSSWQDSYSTLMFGGTGLIAAGGAGILVGTLAESPPAGAAVFAAGGAAAGWMAGKVGAASAVTSGYVCRLAQAYTTPAAPAVVPILVPDWEALGIDEPCPAGSVRFTGQVLDCDGQGQQESTWDDEAGELTVHYVCPTRQITNQCVILGN